MTPAAKALFHPVEDGGETLDALFVIQVADGRPDPSTEPTARDRMT